VCTYSSWLGEWRPLLLGLLILVLLLITIILVTVIVLVLPRLPLSGLGGFLNSGLLIFFLLVGGPIGSNQSSERHGFTAQGATV
jgi:hypothetical protein